MSEKSNEIDILDVKYGDEALELKKEAEEKAVLPPKPEGLFPITAEEEPMLLYKGNLEDISLRLKTKVLQVWLAWASLRTNERLIELVNQTETSNQEDIFYLKQIVVSVVDRLGKVLAITDIVQELFSKQEMDEDVRSGKPESH